MVLLFVNWWGPGLLNIFLAIGLVGWVTEARLVRGQFLSLREQEYVSAAQVAGASSPYIIFKHMLPNSLYADHRRTDVWYPNSDFHRGRTELRWGRNPATASELGTDGGRGQQSGLHRDRSAHAPLPSAGHWPHDAGLHLPGRWSCVTRSTRRGSEELTPLQRDGMCRIARAVL